MTPTPTSTSSSTSSSAPGPDPDASPLERAQAFAAKHLDPLAPYALSLLRGAAGFFLAAHGMSKLDHVARFASSLEHKGFPAPTMFAWLAIFGELVCGTLLGLGAATRVAGFFVSFTMLVAVLSSHLSDALEIGAKRGASFELPALIALVGMAFVFLGSGPAGVDAIVMARGEEEPLPQPKKA